MRAHGPAGSISSTRLGKALPVVSVQQQERVVPVIVLQPQAYSVPSLAHVAPSPSCRASSCLSATYVTSHAPASSTAVAALGNTSSNADRNALARVAQLSTLAKSWAKVSRRLPQEPADSTSSDAVRKIISALRLSLSWLEGGNGAPCRADGRTPFERAVQLAVILAELSAAGLPLDADSIAAGVLSEAADSSYLDHDTIRAKMGDGVAILVHDIMRIRTVPARVEVFEDSAASAMREWCIAFNDIRANVVEVVCRLDQLRHMGPLPLYEKQQLALEALQVYAPLGHALGLGAISAAMEDISFQVLFPESYAHTSQWLHTVADPAEEALYAAQQQLLRALDAHPRFNQLASGCVLRARTKSLFSMMKKLLRLGDMAKGGRKPGEIFDLLGMRAVVQPRTDLPAEQAEEAAVQACYIVQEVACSLWRVVNKRTKDYIRHPKTNGYRSIHLTICLQSVMQEMARQAQHVHQRNSPPVHPNFKQDLVTAGEAWSSMDAEDKLQQLAQRAQRGSSTFSMDSASSLNSFNSQSSQDDTEELQSTCSQASGDESDTCMSTGAAPYLELQIRTQSMDDRAESGEAAHTAYKGGLDARQARQLQAWSSELQQRLAFKPQGKLLLPPSVVAELDRSISVMDSVDLDLDYIPFEMNVKSAADQAVLGGGSSSSGRVAGTVHRRGGSGEVLLVEDVQGTPSDIDPAGLQAQATQEGSQQGGVEAQQEDSRSVAGVNPVSPAAASLFKFIDSNGDGRVSLSELMEQLTELTGSVPAPSPSPSPLGLPTSALLGAGAFTPGQLAYPPELLAYMQHGWGIPDSAALLGPVHNDVNMDSTAWLDSPFGGISLDSARDYGMWGGAPRMDRAGYALQGYQSQALPDMPGFISIASMGSQDEDEGRAASLQQGSFPAPLQGQGGFVAGQQESQDGDSSCQEGVSGGDGSGEDVCEAVRSGERNDTGLERVVRALYSEPGQLAADEDEGMSLDEFAAFLQQAGDLRRRLSSEQQPLQQPQQQLTQ